MFDVFYYNKKPNLFPHEIKAATLEDAAFLSTTEFFWYIDGNNDYSNFDFNFKPAPWQEEYIHIWPSQWQKNGGVYLSKKRIVEMGDLWMDSPSVKTSPDAHEIWYVDQFNYGSEEQLLKLKEKYKNVRNIRYVDSYLETIKRIISKTDEKYIWVINSICDYSDFDFSWHPSSWLKDYFHIFPSNDQEFGDTFFIDVENFKRCSKDIPSLTNLANLNFCQDQVVKRDVERIVYNGENLIDKISKHEFKTSHAIFSPYEFKFVPHTPSNWSHPKITIISRCGSTVVVPKQVIQYDIEQVYDFPRVHFSPNLLPEVNLDVIFLSNRETVADDLYDHLKRLNPNAKRINGINGRSEAIKEAARQSSTEWFLLVPAKLEVNPNFDWNWQPAYLEKPRHYIFKAKNPCNGLRYGHMAMVAYNKYLVLKTDNPGLDFTQSAPHWVMDINSGTSRFNEDPKMAWRTAFREVIKLLHYQSLDSSEEETNYRLEQWSTVFKGKNSEWVNRGVSDARDYFLKSGGNLEKLKLTYSWEWLDKNYNYFS